MTDEGTHGLTGRILGKGEMENELPEEERWARFEGLAFLKEPTGNTLGARGRGKFVFVGASKQSTILYDSLREDSTYRFGIRFNKKTDSDVVAYNEKEGREKLDTITGGIIKPLTNISTRIIIVDPIDELVESVKNGNFLRYIGETWWEIIEKYNVKITLKFNDHEYIATPLSEFKLPEEDSKEYCVWIKENIRIPCGGQEYKIKKLHIISNRKGPVPEEIQGVAMQRGGMKICCIHSRQLPEEIAETIYGYVTFNEKTEQQLRIDEGLEHNSFNFKKTLPMTIKHFIENEINTFAREKLGWRADVRAIRRQMQRNAERQAIVAINRLAERIGLGPGSKRDQVIGEDYETKEIRVQISMNLPRRQDLRVNYNETISNISIRAVNNSKKAIFVRLKLFLRYFDKLIKTFAEFDVKIDSSSKSDWIDPFQEVFLPETYPDRGKYTIVARMVSLEEESRGKILDEKRRVFYLEEDPPGGRGLFERIDPVEYETYISIMGEARTGERGGYIFEYNIKHPAYNKVCDDEDDLAGYLFHLMAYEVCKIDLRQAEPKLFKPKDIVSPENILIKTNLIIGQLMDKYYRRG